MDRSETDRIEKKIVLRAPRARVWRAISDAQEFGAWFGVAFEGAFRPGQPLRGKIVKPPGYEHVKWEVVVDKVEPQRLFSFRWRPYAIDPAVDYSAEPMTLIEFRLEEVPGGTQLTLTESGFQGIPLARRAEAFRMNDGGWAAQMENIARHVAETR